MFNELRFQITIEEVKHAFSELKSCKAHGLDSITGQIIKASAPIIIPVHRKIFNHILNTGTYLKTLIRRNNYINTPTGSNLAHDNYCGITV